MIRRIIPLILLGMLLSGCWDRTEINERAYVWGLGIDFVDPIAEEDGASEAIAVPDAEPPLYRITAELPRIAEGDTQGQGGSAQSPAIVITATGHAPLQIRRSLAIRTSRQIFLGHLQAVIIGEQVARQGILDVLDFIDRTAETDRRMVVLIAQGEAKKILEVVPYQSDTVAEHLLNSLKFSAEVARSYESRLHDVMVELRQNGNALMGRVRAGEGELQTGGSAVIKDDRLIGWLGEIETQAIKMLRNQKQSGLLSAPHPVHPQRLITFLIHNSKAEHRLTVDGSKIRVHVRINVEGDVEESTSQAIAWDANALRTAEKAIAEVIRTMLHGVISQLQDEYRADLLGWSQLFHRIHPALWHEIQEDWDDEFFPYIEVSLEVQVKIRRVGLSL